MKRIAYLTLTEEWHNSTIVDLLYEDKHGFETARGKIESGQGVGEKVIKKFLPENSLTKKEIENALKTIKASDIHLSIIEGVKDKIAAEHEAAEREAEAARKAKLIQQKQQKAAERKAEKEAEELQREKEAADKKRQTATSHESHTRSPERFHKHWTRSPMRGMTIKDVLEGASAASGKWLLFCARELRGLL